MFPFTSITTSLWSVCVQSKSLRVSKGFVNRLWLWRVYHVVPEEMLVCPLRVSSRSLNTAFLCSYRPHLTVIHTDVYVSRSMSYVPRKSRFYCTNFAHATCWIFNDDRLWCTFSGWIVSWRFLFFFLPTQASLLPLTMKKLWLTSVCATQWLCSFKLVPWMSTSSQIKKEKTLQPHWMVL